MPKVIVTRRTILEAIRKEELVAGNWFSKKTKPGRASASHINGQDKLLKECQTCAVGNIFRKLIPTATVNDVNNFIMAELLFARDYGASSNEETALQKAQDYVEKGEYLAALSKMFETYYFYFKPEWRSKLSAWVRANLPKEIHVDINGFTQHLSPKYANKVVPSPDGYEDEKETP